MDLSQSLALAGSVIALGSTAWYLLRKMVSLDGLDGRLTKLEAWKETRDKEVLSFLAEHGYAKTDVVDQQFQRLQASQEETQKKLDLLLEHILKR